MHLPPYEQQLDPFPYFAAMRRDNPVAHDAYRDEWSVYRYDDVRTVIKDASRFASNPGLAAIPIPTPEQGRPSLMRLDPPDHRRIRSLVAPDFAPARMARLTATIARLAHGLIDNVATTGRMDVIEDLAYPLPVMVIAEMLGIPPVDHAMYRRWADMLLGRRRRIMSNLPPSDDVYWANQEMDAYFGEILRQRRRQPQDDLISQWATLQAAGKLTEIEAIGLCTLLLVAGHVTTVNLIGNSLWSLLEHPEVWARLRQAPELIPAALEEALRYRSPVQIVPRITTDDVELGGHTIPKGRFVVAWLTSANRDETVFPDPDRFDVDRHPGNHLAFGTGIHVCLGGPLARLEGSIVLRTLLERLPDLHLAPHTTLRAAPHPALFGLRNLPIVFEPAQVVAA